MKKFLLSIFICAFAPTALFAGDFNYSGKVFNSYFNPDSVISQDCIVLTADYFYLDCDCSGAQPSFALVSDYTYQYVTGNNSYTLTNGLHCDDGSWHCLSTNQPMPQIGTRWKNTGTNGECTETQTGPCECSGCGSYSGCANIRCKANHYLVSGAGTTSISCTACPNGGTSAAGSTAETDCKISCSTYLGENPDSVGTWSASGSGAWQN